MSATRGGAGPSVGGRAAATKDRLLDAFETLLVQGGSAAATLDAVAALAGVSKGGLLYHFRSKDDLVDAMLVRVRDWARDDLEAMRSDPDGAVEYYLRTSANDGTDIDRTLVAVVRVAQESDPRAAEAMDRVHAMWLAELTAELGDPLLARAVQLLGDGMYYTDVFGLHRADDLEACRTAVRAMVTGR